MIQEEKQILLKDLCAMLPYGINAEIVDMFGYTGKIHISVDTLPALDKSILLRCKPYLRPMSSMTEEEKNELKEHLDAEEVDCNGFGYSEGGTLENYISSIPYSICADIVDWLNARHFDYRGLIEKGLALEAPEDMY